MRISSITLDIHNIGVGKKSGLIHTVKTTPASVHDIAEVLTGKEKAVSGDIGFLAAVKYEDTMFQSSQAMKSNVRLIVALHRQTN